MKVTENLKKAATTAHKYGYEYVYSILGSYMATTYCQAVSIDRILSAELGKELSPGRGKGKGLSWAGCLNTRHMGTDCIGYMRLLKLFGEIKP